MGLEDVTPANPMGFVPPAPPPPIEELEAIFEAGRKAAEDALLPPEPPKVPAKLLAALGDFPRGD